MNPPHYRRSRAALQTMQRGENVRTIVIALVANVIIAVAKLIAGLMSRSSGLLAEAAHSFADTLNEVFLTLAVWRARQPPDAAHPLGHGREQFLWALMAAIGSFLIGGCFSVAMALYRLTTGGELGHPTAAWVVLAIALVADGTSWLQSMSQARHEAAAAGRPLWKQLFRSSDPVVRAIVVEDTAALAGVVIAATGLLIATVTHNAAADSIASLIIGVLLAVTAFGLARPLADFLVGRSLAPEYLDRLRDVVQASPAVEQIISMQAVYIGPKETIVAAKIHPSERLSADELARAMDDLDHALRRESPYVADVYLDVTAQRASDRPQEA